MPSVSPPSHVQSRPSHFVPAGACDSSAPVAYSVTATSGAGAHSSTAWSVTGSSMITRTSRPSNDSPWQYIAAANDAPLEKPSTMIGPHRATASRTIVTAASYSAAGKYSHCLAPHPSALPVGQMVVRSPDVVVGAPEPPLPCRRTTHRPPAGVVTVGSVDAPPALSSSPPHAAPTIATASTT